MPIVIIVKEPILKVIRPDEVSTGGDGMPVRGVSSVTAANVDYSSEIPIRRQRNSYQPLKNEVEDGLMLGTGTSAKPGSQIAGGLRETIRDGVEHLNAAADIFNKGLHFKIHEDTEQLVVEIINKETGEVIRQIPPEYMLEVIAKIDALLGLFIDERV